MHLLEVKNITKKFSIKSGFFANKDIYAVDDVSFYINHGETLGLVGESGCGKSTLGLIVLRLIEPNAGKVCFDNDDITSLSWANLRSIRRKMQMIFQDPYSSLNPRMNVEDIIAEPLIVHDVCLKSELKKKVEDLIDLVGLPKSSLSKYPHEFSGGQRQRVGIARAVALEPKLIVADEAVSALDVSIRGGILNLLTDLKTNLNLSYLFVSHDLNVVEYISDRIAVMYLGKIVELLPKPDFNIAVHPYTRALYSAMPSIFKGKSNSMGLKGDLPSLATRPNGCVFHPRCEFAMEKCKTTEPTFESIGSGHFVACHLPRR